MDIVSLPIAFTGNLDSMAAGEQMKKIDVDTWSRRSVLGAFAAATAATSALVPQTVLPADAAKPSVASSAARPSRKTPIVSTTAGKVRG